MVKEIFMEVGSSAASYREGLWQLIGRARAFQAMGMGGAKARWSMLSSEHDQQTSLTEDTGVGARKEKTVGDRVGKTKKGFTRGSKFLAKRWDFILWARI